MKRVKGVLVAVVAAPLLVLAVAPGASAGAVTFHGTFDGQAVTYNSCTPAVTEPVVATGVWSVNFTPARDATVSVAMLENGKLHVAYGGALMAFESVSQTASTFTVRADVGDGDWLTLELKADGELLYTVAPYHKFGRVCTSVVIHGTLGR